jgi:hypothetical protein
LVLSLGKPSDSVSPPRFFFMRKCQLEHRFLNIRSMGWVLEPIRYLCSSCNFPLSMRGSNFGFFSPRTRGKKNFSKSKKKKCKIVVLTQFLIFSPQIDMKILPNTYIIHPACHTTFLKIFFFFFRPLPPLFGSRVFLGGFSRRSLRVVVQTAKLGDLLQPL